MHLKMAGIQNRQDPVYTGKVNIVLNGINSNHNERTSFYRIPVFTGAAFGSFFCITIFLWKTSVNVINSIFNTLIFTLI